MKAALGYQDSREDSSEGGSRIGRHNRDAPGHMPVRAHEDRAVGVDPIRRGPHPAGIGQLAVANNVNIEWRAC
jgi:hypothetical protein